MAEPSRRKFLLDVVSNFFAARRAWVETGPDHITRQLEEATNDLIDAWGEGDVPGELRRLERVVANELRPAWEEFTDRANRTGDTRELPGQAFWAAVGSLERIEREARPQPRQIIETIAELTAQKVSDNQICEIYGWKDDEGRPELWKLREERQNPGTHTADWISPAERRRREQEAKEEQIRERIRQREGQKLHRLTAPCKESLEELIEQGLSARQIAQMRRCTIEEVFAAADEAGLDRPPLEYESLNAQRGPMDPELSEEAARVYEPAPRRRSRPRKPLPQPVEEDAGEEAGEAFDDAETEDYDGLTAGDYADEPAADAAAGEPIAGALTIEQEILEYHRAGLEPRDIAANVKEGGKSVGLRKVNAIIRRYQENPADFASAE